MLARWGEFKRKIERNENLLPMIYGYKRFKRLQAIKKAEKKSFPDSLTLETTNLCNIACIKCPREDLTRPLGFMDYDFFKKIIDESLKHGRRKQIGLVMMGEATMHPHLVEMVRYMSENKAADDITLNTNAILLNEELSQGLIRAGLGSIRFSIDAAKAETYKLLMQRNRYERFVNNIQGFIDTKKKMGASTPTVIIRVTLSEENKNEIEEIRNRWQDQADHFEIVPAMNWAGAISLKAPNPMPVIDRKTLGPCTELWHTMYVNQDGKVALCCVDWDNEFDLGDLTKNTISEIWNNEVFGRMRAHHKKGSFNEIPYCEGCNIRAVR